MPATALEPTRAPAERRRPRVGLAALGVLILFGAVVLPAGTSAAATAVGLGNAESFRVLGATTVTNTGPSFLDGDLGVHPGDALVGFEESGGPGIVTGGFHDGDATAGAAQSDARSAYGALADQACNVDLTGQDLGGLTLTPDVYCFDTTAQLTGALTLNALGDPDATFIFRIGTALTTASDSSVQFTDDFASCGVFWQVGSAATLGTDTTFVGTVIAQTEAITAKTGATVEGRLLALTAAVTLDTNVITAVDCSPDEGPNDEPPVDEPPADDSPTDDGPTDDGPTDGGPTDDGPTDDTATDDAPTDDGAAGAPGVVAEGAPTTPDGTTGAPVVPLSAGPGAPGPTGGPGVPGLTGGPAAPRPPLAATGSSMLLASYGMLAIVIGCGLVSLTERKRATPAMIQS